MKCHATLLGLLILCIPSGYAQIVDSITVLSAFPTVQRDTVATAARPTSDSLIVQALREKNITFTHDNSVTLLMTGQEKFDDMFGAIRQAKSSIHLEYFNFRNDSIASLLFDLLRQKAREGVEVRALFDGWGNDSNNRPLKKSHLQALRADSIQIYEFDPMRFPWINHAFTRDHRKIVIIDGQIGYTGGMNVADYYIKGTEEVGEWRDMHCRIEGGAVHQLQQIFIRMWKEVTGEDIWAQKYFCTYTNPHDFEGLKPDTTATAGHKTVGIVNREPHRTSDIIQYFYLNAINDAQDSIKIINPYFNILPSVKTALREAIERGIKVEIMVSEKCDIPIVPDVVFYNVHQLMEWGADIWIYKPGFHHSKIMMVDGRFCTVGSANLNSRSMRYDYEENAVIVDPNTTRELDDMFDRDKQECIYLTPEVWDTFRTPWQKFRGWLYHLLTPFI